MLEVGKAGSAGTARGELPILREGAVVATLHASNWKETATAVVGERQWAFAKHKGELTGRWADEPEDAARLWARLTPFWRGTHRSLVGGRQVAESGTTGGWSPRPTLSADDSLPLHHQVFLLWLELVLSRRNTAAVGVVAGAAVIGGTS